MRILKVLCLTILLSFNSALLAQSHELELYTAQPIGDTYLKYDLTDVPGLEVVFDVEAPSVITVSGHVGIQTLMWDVTVGIAFDLTIDGEPIPGSTNGEGIQIDRHYYDSQLHGLVFVEPGEHRLSVRGRSYSSYYPGSGDLAFVKPPDYGLLIVRIEPLAKE